MKSFIRIIPLLFALCALQTFAGHITVEGNVSGEWDTDTVLVAGDITIANGQSLLIHPGTVVEFQGSFVFYVEGSVQAQGTGSDRIIFCIADTAGFGTDSIPDGGWRGIRFDHVRITNDPSSFKFCSFSSGKRVSADPAEGNGGVISVDGYNGVAIDNCVFDHNFATYNGGAIYLDSADIAISHSSFFDNGCGPAVAPWGYGGAICSDSSNPEIRWNFFENNYSTGVGGALAVRYEDCNVYNNIFQGNTSGLGGAFGFLHIPECSYRINNNLIVNNSAAYFGGGAANLVASPIYINNTIAFNQAMYGGGFYCKDSVSPDFYNTVIWANTAGVGPQGYLFEVYSQADFFYCDVEGGPSQFGGSGGGEAFFGAYESCLDTVPVFTGNGDHPYSLAAGSPLIDAGGADTSGFYLPPVDLAGMPRISRDVIDIGAYEYFPVFINEEDVVAGQIKVWPNPFRDYVNVEVDSRPGEDIVVEVYDMMGRKIFQSEENFSTGNNAFSIQLPGTLDGMLILRVNTGKEFCFSKLYRISER